MCLGFIWWLAFLWKFQTFSQFSRCWEPTRKDQKELFYSHHISSTCKRHQRCRCFHRNRFLNSPVLFTNVLIGWQIEIIKPKLNFSKHIKVSLAQFLYFNTLSVHVPLTFVRQVTNIYYSIPVSITNQIINLSHLDRRASTHLQ